MVTVLLKNLFRKMGDWATGQLSPVLYFGKHCRCWFWPTRRKYFQRQPLDFNFDAVSRYSGHFCIDCWNDKRLKTKRTLYYSLYSHSVWVTGYILFDWRIHFTALA